MNKNIRMRFDGLILLVRMPVIAAGREPVVAVTLTMADHDHAPILYLAKGSYLMKAPLKAGASAIGGYDAFSTRDCEIRFPMFTKPVPCDRDDDDDRHVVDVPPSDCDIWEEAFGPMSCTVNITELTGQKVMKEATSAYRNDKLPVPSVVTSRVILSGGFLETLPNERKSQVLWNFSGQPKPDEVRVASDSVLLTSGVGDAGVMELEVRSLIDGTALGHIVINSSRNGPPEAMLRSFPVEPHIGIENGELVHFKAFYAVFIGSIKRGGPQYYADCTRRSLNQNLEEYLKDLGKVILTSDVGPCPTGGGEGG